MYVCPHVCTYGVILRIRRTEGCQSVGNKRAREQKQMYVLERLFRSDRTIIDITLSWNLKTGLTKWKVYKELNHSDHNTIKFQLETEMETIPVHRPWNKADWQAFKQELELKEIYIYTKQDYSTEA